MESLIAEIKKKRELSDIPDELVKETLSSYLKKNQINIPKKEKELKLIVKEVRAMLRRYVGQYQSSASLDKKIRLLRLSQSGLKPDTFLKCLWLRQIAEQESSKLLRRGLKEKMGFFRT